MKTEKQLRFLVVEDEQELQDLIGFVLESTFSASIQYASSGNQAIELLKNASDKIDLIICDYNMPDGNGADVNSFLHQHNYTIPFILCSSDDPKMHPELSIRPIAGFAEKPFFEKPLIKEIERILKTTVSAFNQESEMTKAHFIRAHIRLYKLANVVPCEVFIRLSDEKFVKLYKETDIFSDFEYKKWHDKKTEYLYIHRQNAEAFFDKLVHAFQSLTTARSNEESPQDVLPLSLDLIDSLHDIGSKIGFSKEFEKMTKFSISRTINMVNKNPALSELLKRVLNEKNYISSHSFALSFVACWLSSKMEWHSEQTVTKLILASFLHDITISDQEVAKIQNESEFFNEKIKILKDGKEQWKEHPIKAARIAAQFTEVPPDVDVIIAQHHERPHGEGFPNHFSHLRISPLAALFIIAHDMVLFFDSPEAILGSFVEQRKDVYDIGQFKRILERIEESTEFNI